MNLPCSTHISEDAFNQVIVVKAQPKKEVYDWLTIEKADFNTIDKFLAEFDIECDANYPLKLHYIESSMYDNIKDVVMFGDEILIKLKYNENGVAVKELRVIEENLLIDFNLIDSATDVLWNKMMEDSRLICVSRQY